MLRHIRVRARSSMRLGSPFLLCRRGAKRNEAGSMGWLALPGRGSVKGMRPTVLPGLPAARSLQVSGSFEEFLSGGPYGLGGGEARSLVAYCFSVGDDFRFASAHRALVQAYGAQSRIFFQEVVHLRVRSDAVPSWPSGAVHHLGNMEEAAQPPEDTQVQDGMHDEGGSFAIDPKHDLGLQSENGNGQGQETVGMQPAGRAAMAAVSAPLPPHGRVAEGSALDRSYGDVFLFRDGSLVLWDIDEHAQHALLALIDTFRPLQSDEASLSSVRTGAQRGAGTKARGSTHVWGGAGWEDVSVGVSKETLQWRYSFSPRTAPLLPFPIPWSIHQYRQTSMRAFILSHARACRYGAKFGFETRENRRGRGSEMLVLSAPAQQDDTKPLLQTNILEKVALSHGMQRSVKMDRIEFFMDALVESLKTLPSQILIGKRLDSWHHRVLQYLRVLWGPLGASDAAHKEALKKMGEILRLRDIINLRGSLETPDVYWDLPQLEGWADLSPSLARLVCVHIVALVPRKRSNDPLKFEDI